MNKPIGQSAKKAHRDFDNLMVVPLQNTLKTALGNPNFDAFTLIQLDNDKKRLRATIELEAGKNAMLNILFSAPIYDYHALNDAERKEIITKISEALVNMHAAYQTDKQAPTENTLPITFGFSNSAYAKGAALGFVSTGSIVGDVANATSVGLASVGLLNAGLLLTVASGPFAPAVIATFMFALAVTLLAVATYRFAQAHQRGHTASLKLLGKKGLLSQNGEGKAEGGGTPPPTGGKKQSPS